MLSENLQELLSAYVDGELDSTEFERVMAMLRESEAAQKYVAELRSVSQNLKSLPGYAFPQKVTQQFLVKQKLARSHSLRRTVTSVVAIAAAMLVAVGVWWYVSKPETISEQPVLGPSGNIAINKNTKDVNSPHVAVVPKKPLELGPYIAFAQQALAQGYDEIENVNHRFTESINWLAQAESIREGKFLDHQASILTGPVKNTGSYFKTMNRPLPAMFSTADYSLDKMKSHVQLKETSVLDLSSRDNIKTMARLLEAGKQAQLPIMVDEELQLRLKKNLPATFMVYLENLTETQMNTFLQALETVDYWKQSELKKDSTVTSMLFYPLDASGRNQVAKSLGLNEGQLEQAKASKHQAAVALSYFSFRLPQSLSENTRKATATLGGTSPDRLSLVIMVRSTR